MIRFLLDDEMVELADVPADLTVLDWLRLHRGRTGTKEGCGSGDCGACTVVVVSSDEGSMLRYDSLNACIAFAGSLHGRQLLTVESLERDGALHPVQQAMLDEHGSQCGFCTPGFVMSMFALAEAPDAPSVERVASGEPADVSGQAVAASDQPGVATPVAESRSPTMVVRAEAPAHADAVVVDMHPGASRPLSRPGGWMHGLRSDDALGLSHRIDRALGGNLCRCTGYRPIKRAAAVALAEHRPWLEPAAATALSRRLLALSGEAPESSPGGYLRPRTLAALAELRLARPRVPLVAGATDLALEVTQRLQDLPSLLSPCAVPELQRLERIGDTLHIGAAASLNRLYDAATVCLPPLAELLLRYGSDPVRNAATLGGSLGSASPIGDLAPVLLALGADIVLQRGQMRRTVAIDDFFVGYRETVMTPGEFILEVRLPLPDTASLFAVHKVSKRMDDDISTVCLAAHLRLGTNGSVEQARLGYGGMAATPARAAAMERALTGRAFDEAAVAAAIACISDDFAPIGDARASARYRLEVAGNLLRRCHAEHAGQAAPVRLAALEPALIDSLSRPADAPAT